MRIPRDMAATFNLIIEDDAGKQIVVPFAKEVITIGRKEGNTIRLTERNVSRFHAKLSKENGHVLVEDLESFNGVKLNGDRIAGRVQVAAGDVIEIGDYHLELRSTQPQPAPPQGLGPAGARSAAVGDVGAGADDEFEGDTQRWDPPTGGAVIPVGQVRTAEASPPPNQFAEGSGDTERLDMAKFQKLSAQAWSPPPPPKMSLTTSEMEPTARQPIASVPVGAAAPPPPSFSPPPFSPPSFSPPPFSPPPFSPPAPQPMFSSPSAPTMPAPAAPARGPVLESLHDATQDMPMPAARLPAGAGRVEQTEQIRAVPPAHPGDDVSVPRLVVLNTVFAGSAFPLRAPEAVLGRTDDNDIVLEHRSVSRNHCKLVREGDRVRILDLKSANGILVNGEEVEQAVLRHGDVVELGKVRIRFVPMGERFAVAPDEIERARLADATGDVDEASHTANVTSPMRQPQLWSTAPAAAPRPVLLYAVVAVLVVVVIVLAAVVLTRGGPTETTPAPTPTPTAVTTPTPAPAPDPAPAPAPVATEPPAPPPVLDLQLDEPEPTPTGTPKKPVDRKKPFDAAKAADEAKVLMVRGEYAQAVVHLKQIVDRNTNDARAHLQLGICYAQLRKNALAREHYKRFLDIQPTGPDADRVRKSLESL
jgi:pSer/pThr/pTyr-binding forkhead associated (FHA) protein